MPSSHCLFLLDCGSYITRFIQMSQNIGKSHTTDYEKFYLAEKGHSYSPQYRYSIEHEPKQ